MSFPQPFHIGFVRSPRALDFPQRADNRVLEAWGRALVGRQLGGDQVRERLRVGVADQLRATARELVAEELLEKWPNTEKGSKVRRFIVQENGLNRCWLPTPGSNSEPCG